MKKTLEERNRTELDLTNVKAACHSAASVARLPVRGNNPPTRYVVCGVCVCVCGVRVRVCVRVWVVVVGVCACVRARVQVCVCMCAWYGTCALFEQTQHATNTTANSKRLSLAGQAAMTAESIAGN
jgi:hypothetical protein